MLDNLICINVNWTNRSSGTTDNFIYKIEIPNEILKNISHVWITQITLPKWFYTIWNDYNEFHLIENNIIIDIILPIGNYNQSQFFNKIWSLLTLASQNNITYLLSNQFQTHDTGLILFTAWNNINNLWLWLSFTDWNDIFQALGFWSGWINNFVNNSLLSTQIIN